MSKYRITVTRTVRHSHTITVDDRNASTLSAAKIFARELADELGDHDATTEYLTDWKVSRVVREPEEEEAVS